jgi:2,3,4,5-tetrahydropyridine-2-carboxylate N-succinyltransferase/tetrahydrodipicolinate N-acetyltransferase
MRTEDIIRLIKESKKKTPCIAYLSGDLEGMDAGGAVFVGGKDFGILSGDRGTSKKSCRRTRPGSGRSTWRPGPGIPPFPWRT